MPRKKEKYRGKQQREESSVTIHIRNNQQNGKNILRKDNIKRVFTTKKTIGQILKNSRNKINLENQGVHEMPCGECPRSYLGQINKRIVARKDVYKTVSQK